MSKDKRERIGTARINVEKYKLIEPELGKIFKIDCFRGELFLTEPTINECDYCALKDKDECANFACHSSNRDDKQCVIFRSVCLFYKDDENNDEWREDDDE